MQNIALSKISNRIFVNEWFSQSNIEDWCRAHSGHPSPFDWPLLIEKISYFCVRSNQIPWASFLVNIYVYKKFQTFWQFIDLRSDVWHTENARLVLPLSISIVAKWHWTEADNEYKIWNTNTILLLVFSVFVCALRRRFVNESVFTRKFSGTSRHLNRSNFNSTDCSVKGVIESEIHTWGAAVIELSLTNSQRNDA